MLLLLPSERDLSAAETGLRIACRDAALRAGKPFVRVGRAAAPTKREDDPPPARGVFEGVDPEPIFWICVGGAILGAIYLMTRKRNPEPAETFYERVAPTPAATEPGGEAAEPSAVVALPQRSSPPPQPRRSLHPLSDDRDLAAAFDRDVGELWAEDWRG